MTAVNPLFFLWNQYVFLPLVTFKISHCVWFSAIFLWCDFPWIYSASWISSSLEICQSLPLCPHHSLSFILLKGTYYMHDKSSYCIPFVSYPFFIFLILFSHMTFLDIYFESIFQFTDSLLSFNRLNSFYCF